MYKYILLLFYLFVLLVPSCHSAFSKVRLPFARYGMYGLSYKTKVVFAGGYTSPTNVTTRIDVYDTSTKLWTKLPPLNNAKVEMATTVADKYAIFAGGRSLENEYYNGIDIYNMDTLVKANSLSMSFGRANAAATSLSKYVFIAGGDTGTAYLGQLIVIDTSNMTFLPMMFLTSPRTKLSAAATGDTTGRVYFAGGSSGNSTFRAAIDILDTFTWTLTTKYLSVGRHSISALRLLSSLIIFAGGFDINGISSRVDLIASNGDIGQSQYLQRANFSYAANGELAFYMGGSNGTHSALNTYDVYNSLTKSWRTLTLDTVPRTLVSGATAGNVTFFAGGLGLDGLPTDVVDVFIPECTADSECNDNKRCNGVEFCINHVCETTNVPCQNLPICQQRCVEDAVTFQCVNATSGTSCADSIFCNGAEVCNGNGECISASATPCLECQTCSESDDQCITGDNYDDECNMIASSDNDKKDQLPLIIGVAVGGAAFLILATVVTFLVIQRRRNKNSQLLSATSESNNIPTYYGAPPSQSNSTYLPIGLVSGKAQGTTFGDSNANSSEWHISYSELVIKKEIGRGAFGVVYKATWRSAPVAVKKMITETMTKDDIASFQNEMLVMKNLRPSPNVVTLIGVCDEPLCVITEFYAKGSLRDLLKSGKTITEEVRDGIVLGIARGMLHLSMESIVHRDLAARNVLLTGSYEPKICDFGMSRVVESDGGKTQNVVGPLLWMAPECLSDHRYSSASDVWAFGITVIEIYTRKDPYEALRLPPLNVAMKIMTREISPQIPSNVPTYLAEVVRDCFIYDEDKRISFKQICELLECEDESKRNTIRLTRQHTNS